MQGVLDSYCIGFSKAVWTVFVHVVMFTCGLFEDERA